MYTKEEMKEQGYQFLGIWNYSTGVFGYAAELWIRKGDLMLIDEDTRELKASIVALKLEQTHF